jgi:L-amino acid N-acyltransferase YncA
MNVTVRPAEMGDVEAICAIHNQGITDRIATLDTTLRAPEDTRAWLADHGPRHPVLVAEADGAVIGWASLNRFNSRPAYDHVG